MEATPCPHRVLDDCGAAFSMGCVGGSVFHIIKGMRHSPVGSRWRGGFNAVTLRAPVLGGNFAVWGGLFSTFDCLYAYSRCREDSMNAIYSGATTGGILAWRAGWKAIVRNAIIGGVLLAMIEGLNYAVTSSFSQTQDNPAQAMAPAGYELKGRYAKKDPHEKPAPQPQHSDEDLLVEDISFYDEFQDGFDDDA